MDATTTRFAPALNPDRENKIEQYVVIAEEIDPGRFIPPQKQFVVHYAVCLQEAELVASELNRALAVAQLLMKHKPK